MPRYRLTIEYDGTGYSGWQTQKNARSVQGTLIRAAEQLFGGAVDVQGAGRTDAGVHALAQAAHLEAAETLAPRKILEGLNDRLPSNINVLSVEKAPARFHARHHALARTYLYLISTCRTAFGKRYVWWVRDALNVERMQTACRLFEGFHDFASFADRRLDRERLVDEACQDDGQDRLQQVAGHGQGGRLAAIGAEHVGDAGVAAAEAADVLAALQPGHEDGAVEAAEQVAGNGGQDQGD